MKHLLLLLALSFSFAASATVTITAVTGIPKTSTLGIPNQGAIIYGGIAPFDGPNTGTVARDSCAVTPPTSCTTQPFCACNTQQIGDNVAVTISFTSDQPITDTNGLARVVSIGNNQGQVMTGTTQAYTGPGAVQTISTTWGTLCAAAGSQQGISTCVSTSWSTTGLTMYVGISNGQTFADSALLTVTILGANVPNVLENDDCSGSNGAFCRFTAVPGDAVAYIDDVRGDSGFPGNTTGIRVYVSENNFANASPTNALKTQDFSLGTDGTLSGAIVDELTNDGPIYTFRVAALDLAGNVHSFTSDANITSASFGNCNLTAGAETSTSSCRYKAQPDPVLGILTKDLNCFVATAAYGSSLEPKLTTFRKFRNQFLAVNKMGRKFIYSYYHWGPYAARWISERDWARSVVRAGLWPVWVFSSVALEVGLTKAITLTLMLFIGFAAFIAALTSWVRTSRATNS